MLIEKRSGIPNLIDMQFDYSSSAWRQIRTFRLSLADRVSSRDDSSMARDFKVIVCDDDQDTLFELKEFLVGLGFARLEACCSPRRAVSALEECRDDILLITDLKMPLIDGAQLVGLAKSRALAQGRIAVCIVITGHLDLSSPSCAVDIGADALINKPIDPDELESILRNLIVLDAGAVT